MAAEVALGVGIDDPTSIYGPSSGGSKTTQKKAKQKTNLHIYQVQVLYISLTPYTVLRVRTLLPLNGSDSFKASALRVIPRPKGNLAL